jgi:hypothetical protein
MRRMKIINNMHDLKARKAKTKLENALDSPIDPTCFGNPMVFAYNEQEQTD